MSLELPVWAWWLVLLVACITPIGRKVFKLVIGAAVVIVVGMLDAGRRFG
jgi:hypothetical protein